MSLERAVSQLMRKVERHYYGKYRGFVVSNEDPKKIGRLKVNVLGVLSDEIVTGWAMPCLPYGGDANQGTLFIPDQGAGVWVEFEQGNLDTPIWVGTFWSAPDGKSELPKPNNSDGSEESEVQDPVTRKIIKTKKGHTIQFEDKDGEETVIVMHKIDEEKKNVISMAGTGITITDFKQNKIEMTDSAFTITSKVAFTIDASGQAVKIKASTIDLTKA